MLKDEYIKKREKYYKFYEFFYKFRVLFIILTILLVGSSATLLSIKGMIINDIKVSDITYGEKLEYHSKAMFDEILYYEFKESNSESWSKEEPIVAGNYSLRAVSRNIFGKLRYGHENQFSINKKDITLSISGSFKYSEIPSFSNSFEYTDYISECKYDVVKEYSSEYLTYDISIYRDSLKIINKEGIDVTSSYNINLNSTYKVKMTKGNLKLYSKGEATYDSKEHSTNDLNVKTGTLNNEDRVEIVKVKSFVSAGEHSNFPTVKVINKNNIDVTKLYNITFTSESKFIINKKKLTIKTYDCSREYNGKSTTIECKYSLVEGELLSGDILKMYAPLKEDVGTYKNEGKHYITNSKGNDVSSNYQVEIIPGTFKITPRTCNVEIKGSNKEYNSYVNDNYSYTVSNLIEGHYFDISEKDNSYAHANTYKNHDIDFYIFANERNVTSNYLIKVNYSNGYTVSKRPITIETGSFVHKYDGKEFSYKNLKIISGTLADDDSISVTTFDKFIKVGTYSNNLGYKITSTRLGDVTNDYQVSIKLGKITIAKEINAGGNGSATPSDFETNMNLNKDNGTYSLGQGLDSETSELPTKFRYKTLTRGNAFLVDYINYGYYNGNGFEASQDYEIKYGINPEEFVSTLLKGKKDETKGIVMYNDNSNREFDLYLNYPYFNKSQKTDTYPVLSDLSSKEVEVTSINYNYYKEPELLDDIKDTSSISKEENNYRKHVKKNYNGMDNKTYEFISDFINSKNIDTKNISSIAGSLMNLFKSEYKYSMYNLEAGKASNPIIAFLGETKIGKCDYFASAACLIYRALGYSSRMITGYGVGGSANTIIEVSIGHAITQVYIEGKGWVSFDFTVAPSIDNNGGSESESGSGSTSGDNGDIDIILTSDTYSTVYDGTYQKADGVKIKRYTTDEVTVETYFNKGYLKAGTYTNYFDYLIYDKDGNIVNSNKYSVEKLYGELTILTKDLHINELKVEVSKSDINGNIIKCLVSNNELCEEDKIEEFMILSSSISSSGYYKAIPTKITHSSGVDVTNSYSTDPITINLIIK